MKQFGGKVTGELKEKFERSSNWRDGRFHNPMETSMRFPIKAFPKFLYQQFRGHKRDPQQKLPVQPLDKQLFQNSGEPVAFVWYGHSVLLIRVNGKTVLIDPMFGSNAAPIAPFAASRFSENTLDLIDDLPPIDLVLMTHDHYDHLDLSSIEKLKGKVDHYFTALGVGRHLVHWGIEKERITEFDWWEHRLFEDIDITFTPTRHFSGRGLRDRFQSLWGGWVIKNQHHNIYFSGDSGYGEHFRTVGTRLGPFDIGFMECGQYNEHWHQIHMFPEECIQAAIDAGVGRAVPVHWGGFTLALHHWKDPILRFVQEAANKKLPIGIPEIGDVFTATEAPQSQWWNRYQ